MSRRLLSIKTKRYVAGLPNTAMYVFAVEITLSKQETEMTHRNVIEKNIVK